MRKKGFTIVELIAVILILGIIMTLGVSSYNTISKRVLESNYESKKRLIETKAADYASDTSFLITDIDTLVKNGYLDADNEDGSIINPLTNKKMNCDIVSISNYDGVLYATIKEGYEDAITCETEDIIKTNMNLELKIKKRSDFESRILNYEDNPEWVDEDVVLEIVFKDLNVDENDIEKIVWRTNAFTKEVDVNHDFREKANLLVEVAEILNTTYYVEVHLKDNVVYYAYNTVKVDKQKPIIYDDSIKVTLENAFVERENKLKFTVTDQNGSGIDSYAIIENNDCTSALYTPLDGFGFVETTVSPNKKYYICAKDKAGNFSEEVSTKEVDLTSFIPPVIHNYNDLLELEQEDYDFFTNVYVEPHIFDVTISCDPSKSLKTGEYDVVCLALSDNGLASSTTFHVKHKNETEVGE